LGIFYLGYYAFCMYIVRSRTIRVKKNRNFRPNISLVIPTWNEESTIRGKLKNTLSLSYPKGKLEVIVIDSGSIDNTRKIVKKFSKRFAKGSKKIRLITENKRRGKAAALNKAFKHCKGDIVIISDADCRLDKKILLKSMPYFYDPSIGALTGRESIINFDENVATKTEKKYRDLFYLLRGAESMLDSTYVFDGPFCAFRKDLISRINRKCVADDTEMALKIKKKGYRVLSIPEAVYFEYAPSKLLARTNQKSRRAEGLTQSMINHFSTFFLNKKYGLFGMLIFPAGIFMHIISSFLLIISMITFFLLPQRAFVTLLGIIASALLIPKTRYIILTYLHSQFACFIGTLKYTTSYATSTPDYVWKKIENTRRYGKW